MFKYSTLVFITLISLVVSRPITNNCGQGCVSCGTESCDLCFRRTLDTQETRSGLIGKNCSNRIQPISQASDLYPRDHASIKLTICKKPFSYVFKQGCKNVGFIQNCAVYLEQSNPEGLMKCQACYGGLPDELGGSCSDKYPDDDGQDWSNCEVGYFDGIKGKWGCMSCVSGFFLENTGKCKKIDKDAKGCLIAFGQICKLCDGSNGYHQSQYLGPCARD